MSRGWLQAGSGRPPSMVHRAALVAVIAGLLSLLLFVRVPGNSAWLRAVVNAGHAPVFAGVAALLAILLRRSPGAATATVWPELQRYARAFAFAVMIGMAVEVVQSLMQRPGSLFDVGTNAAGAAIGLGLLALAERAQLPAPRPALGPAAWTLIAGTLAGILFVIWQPVQTARAYAARERSFPVLAEFRDSVPLPMTRTLNASRSIEPLPQEWTRQPGERALRVRFHSGKSGNAWPVRYLLFEPIPDWRGHATLALDVANPATTELSLTLDIVDANHHWALDPPPGVPIVLPARTRAMVRIALDALAVASERRPPDLERIEYLLLVPARAAAAAEVYLVSVRLEP